MGRCDMGHTQPLLVSHAACCLPLQSCRTKDTTPLHQLLPRTRGSPSSGFTCCSHSDVRAPYVWDNEGLVLHHLCPVENDVQV
jgi:hypothetical protein